jgi:hypothetical protein
MIDAIGPVATLLNTIFKWVTEPEGYHELSLNRKLEKLKDATLKAIRDRDYAACDVLIAEYGRLQSSII